MIDVVCTCKRQFRVSLTAVGKSGRCPSCGSRLRLIAPGFRMEQDRFEARLIVEDGPEHKGEQYLVSGPGPVEIGKADGMHIALAGRQISRSHCRLVRSSGGWRVEDNRSTNGLFVNRARLDAAELREGDVLTVGEYTLRYHGAGLAAAVAPPTVPVAPPPVPVAPQADAGDVLLSDDLYALADGEVVETPSVPAVVADGRVPAPAAPTGGPTCPACKRSLATNAKICVFCGIDLRTGRAIITAQDQDLDATYARAEAIIPKISWLMRFGIYPIASEALGTRRPYAVYAISVLTILITSWFWVRGHDNSQDICRLKNYMLWVGDGKPDAEDLYDAYTYTKYGDGEAFRKKLEELQKKAAPTKAKKSVAEETDEEYEEDEDEVPEEMILAAHNALPPDKQCIGHFHAYQLITNAFLHGGIGHLLGNLFFLLFFGSRVNALIGNLATLIVYPILGVLASLAMVITEAGSAPAPCLGASGAVMGMAGLYLALMPIHKIHMAIWFRWGLMAGLRLSMKIFAIRGFWVVLFYIKYDILFTIIKLKTGVAHWAHLGGLLAGLGIGVVLLVGRLVNARGGDVLSGLLGRKSWALIGKPDPDRKPLLAWLP